MKKTVPFAEPSGFRVYCYEKDALMLFGRKKYFGLLAALVLLTLAYVLMSGPANNQAGKFDEGIFKFRRITLAPILIIGTYGSLIFLILKKPKSTCSEEKKK